MEQLEDASPEEQARAAAAEWARLQLANDASVSLRAFSARQLQHRTGCTEGEDVRMPQRLLCWLLCPHLPSHPRVLELPGRERPRVPQQSDAAARRPTAG